MGASLLTPQTILFTKFFATDAHYSLIAFSVSQPPCKLAKCQFPMLKLMSRPSLADL